MAHVRDFINLAVAQTGDQYRWGAQAKTTDPDPKRFDCADLISWAARRLGIDAPDASWLLFRWCHEHGTGMSVRQALATPGALLFRFSSNPLTSTPRDRHVSISLGDRERTMEARSTRYGVGVFGHASQRKWTHAALVPGLDYGGGGARPSTPHSAPAAGRAGHPPTLRRGARGELVKRLQGLLYACGQASVVGPIDGIFGAHTETAVRNVQRYCHAKVDGIVGPVTWYLLSAPKGGR